MGFLGAVMNSLGGMVGEQVFPYYENTALRMSAYDLQSAVEDNENKIQYRAVYLLALMKKDKGAACEIYKRNQTKFENIFTQLYNYRKFKPVIDDFRRIASQGSNWY